MVTERETEVKMNDDATGRKMLQEEKKERKNHKLEFVTSFLPETVLSVSESSSSLGRVLAATAEIFFLLLTLAFGEMRLKHIRESEMRQQRMKDCEFFKAKESSESERRGGVTSKFSSFSSQ